MLNLKNIKSFELIKENLSKKPSFKIHTRGSRKIFISGGKAIAVYHQTFAPETKDDRKNARKIMTETRSAITRYLQKDLSGPEPMERLHPVTYVNRELWKALPVNTEFYLIDANHCYWRVAFILGYINKRLYQKYCDLPEFKTLRNIALAILNTGIKREYYHKGNKTHEIECDVSHYRQVYTNIRHYTYNNSGEVQSAIKDYCIAYRVDGVYTLPRGLAKAKKIFQKNNLLYKTALCVKVDEQNYSTEDGEIKKMV